MNKNLPKPIAALQCDPRTTYTYTCNMTKVAA